MLKVIKYRHHILYRRHQFLCNKEMSKYTKIWWKLIKIANIDRESFHIFWTTWGILMKISGKTWLLIIKSQKRGLHPVFRRYIFWNTHRGITPPPSTAKIFLGIRFSSVNMKPDPQFPEDLVTFIEEILNWKLHFLCCE